MYTISERNDFNIYTRVNMYVYTLKQIMKYDSRKRTRKPTTKQKHSETLCLFIQENVNGYSKSFVYLVNLQKKTHTCWNCAPGV